MKPLRAAVLGLGQMGRKHARVFSDLAGVELVVASDIQGSSNDISLGIPVVETARELLEFNIDLCVIATPTENHFESALLMADSGVNTMIEKPIVKDVELAEKLIEKFKESGLVACVGHVERFNPAISAMREKIIGGQLGEVYQISTRRQGPFVDRVRDIGVVKDLGTHDLDLAMWIVDQSIVSVFANTLYPTGRDGEDLASIVTRFESGIVGNHLVNWLNPFKERAVQVVGENGSFVADTITADLTFWSNDGVSGEWDVLTHSRGFSEGDVVRYAIKKSEPLLIEAQAFRDAVLGISDEVVSLEEGLRVLRVAEACIESARNNSTVELTKKV